MNKPRIQIGMKVLHMDGRAGECISLIATDMSGYPVALVRWMNGGQDKVPLGYLQKIPDFAVV